MINGHTKPSGATSYKETAFGIVSHTQLLPLEVEGTKRGLEYIHDLVKENENVEITPELIRKLHAISFQWIFPNWAGKFRTIQVMYSGKEAPKYFQVPELLENLCADLQIQLNSLPEPSQIIFIDKVASMLAWFQHKFIFIHPFQDYNGRIGRMLTVLLLLKLQVPPVEIQIENKEDRIKYLEAMQAGDEGNLALLEKLISNALVEDLNKMS